MRSRNVTKWVKVAEMLSCQNGCSLPSMGWLKNHGYSGLVSAMQRRPELFAPIKRKNKEDKTPEEWASFAKRLAKKNGSMRPYQRDVFHGHGDETLCVISKTPGAGKRIAVQQVGRLLRDNPELDRHRQLINIVTR